MCFGNKKACDCLYIASFLTNKTNNILMYFKTMVLWNFDLLWKTMVLCKKKNMVLWTNYGTLPKTMELWFTKEKKHGSLPKTKKLWFIIEKKTYGNMPKIIEIFEQIYSCRTLIYYGKTMLIWKK